MSDYVLNSGYWLLFDVAHYCHSPLSKCKGNLQAPENGYMLAFVNYLIDKKRAGEKVHTSFSYLKYLKENYSQKEVRIWHCSKGSNIGWLTIDYNGAILPCDDWQIPFNERLWELSSFEVFKVWRNAVVEKCSGCLWNTHFDAIGIVASGNIGSYIHIKKDLS
jgi:MoaA/NifB/PqqE/SkfB family radical SAM enzyme